MSTLLLRLAAPLQSWGADSKFDIRKTEREPTKSGVIGMIAAALGKKRDEPLDELASLRFGVRVDREGRLLRDFHMVRPTGKNASKPYLTNRYYLSDAVFLVGLEGDPSQLREIEHAIANPVYPLFLGRRSCPPEGRVCLGLRDGDLVVALEKEPWLVGAWRQARHKGDIRLRVLLDAKAPSQASGLAFGRKRDFPISFDQVHRRYGFRATSERLISLPRDVSGQVGSATNHDPILELGGDDSVSVENSAG